MYHHDPRHVDVLVKDFGLERGNSLQTPAVHDVTNDKREPIGPNAIQPLQVASCKMFVLHSRSSRHNMNSERVASNNVKPNTAEPCKVKEANQIPCRPK